MERWLTPLKNFYIRKTFYPGGLLSTYYVDIPYKLNEDIAISQFRDWYCLANWLER